MEVQTIGKSLNMSKHYAEKVISANQYSTISTHTLIFSSLLCVLFAKTVWKVIVKLFVFTV